tara:strand:+ start:83 stop:529 length:447 start_codon:yes stop_codon:yes gene_type:complete
VKLEMHMSNYYLVFDVDRNRVIALAKTENGRATILAGEAMAAGSFDKGEPRLDNDRYWFPLFLCSDSWHPAIGRYIDKLGPPQDSQSKLDAWQLKRSKRRRAEELTPAERESIRDLKSNGVSQRRIAERLGVSRAFVQRLDSSDPPTG